MKRLKVGTETTWDGKVFQLRLVRGTNEHVWKFARENGISNTLS